MSREKQIEEMNNTVLAKYSNTLFLDVKDAYGTLVDAGYRKASEVAREIFAEIDKTAYGDTDFFKMLKKKYESEGIP